MKDRNELLKMVSADMAMINGKIVTVDSEFSIVKAIAVKDGKFLAVGSNEEINMLIDENTEVIDLKNKTVLPGINDNHAHPAIAGVGMYPLSLDLSGHAVNSIANIVNVVSEKVKELKPGEWVRGRGWNEINLEECQNDPSRHFTKHDIDIVTPDNPALLEGFYGGINLVNSRALELAGIDEHSPKPKDGEIVKDLTTGEPTGLLRGMDAKAMITTQIPLWTKEEKRKALLLYMNELNKHGVTSVTDAAVGPGMDGFEQNVADSETLSIYNDLHNEGLLTVRINFLMMFGDTGLANLKGMKEGIPFFGIHTGFGNEWLRLAGVKILADGSILAKGAWMNEEYIGGGHGVLLLPGETEKECSDELTEILIYAHEHGFQIGVHAYGDRAIDACVDALIKAKRKNPWNVRHYIIHSDFVTKKTAKRMGENNIGAGVQPLVTMTTADAVKKVLGERRVERQMPVRTLIDSGVHVTFSSDGPVTSPDWKKGIQAAILRKSAGSGKTIGLDQCITREEAIRAYTIESAWQDHLENIKGSIEVGKYADLCVLGDDILSVDAENIGDIENLMTIVNGKIVYDEGVLR